MSEAQHPLVQFRESRSPRMSQDALGEALGVDGMTVYRWEKRMSVPRERLWTPIESITGIPIHKILMACRRPQSEDAA